VGGDLIWATLACVLLVEGLMPLVAPQVWRRMFAQLLALQDGQLRFVGLLSILIGLLLLWCAS